jgi:hypothetical protein
MIQSGNYKICFIPLNPQDTNTPEATPATDSRPISELNVNLKVESSWGKVTRVTQPVLKFLGVFAVLGAMYVLNTYLLLPQVIIDDTIRLLFLIAISLTFEKALERKTKVRLNGYAVEFQ